MLNENGNQKCFARGQIVQGHLFVMEMQESKDDNCDTIDGEG